MVSFLGTKKRAGRPPKQRTTSISFSAQELQELSHVIAVGQVALQKRLPVVARLKAALTRIGGSVPLGL